MRKRRDKFSSFIIILPCKKKNISSSNFAGINIHCVYLLQNALCVCIYVYNMFVCRADSFLLASSFSPRRRCDLHAKVRAEILIGRAARCINLRIHLPEPGKLGRRKDKRVRQRKRGRESERERKSRTSSEIIHYVPGYNVAHLKQWQMRESGRIIRKNGILPVYAYRMNVRAANIMDIRLGIIAIRCTTLLDE